MATQNFGPGGVNNASRTGPLGQIGAKLGLYEQESVQSCELGSPKVFADGRVYRYSHFSAAVAVGKLVSQDVSLTAAGPLTSRLSDSVSVAKDDYAIGDTRIYLYDTNTFPSTVVANTFAGGYFRLTVNAGIGFQYTIKNSSAGSDTAPMSIDLYDPLAADLDSETGFSITGHPYRNLIIATTTDPLVCGVTMYGMTAAYYGWTQTWGWATVLCDESAGTIAKGGIAQLSDGVSGAAQPLGGGYVSYISSETLIVSDLTLQYTGLTNAGPIIGYFGEAGVDAQYHPVFLQIQGG